MKTPDPRTRFRIPVVVVLTLGGLASLGGCRQAVWLASEEAGTGPSVGFAVLRTILFFAAAGAAWWLLGPRPGEPAPPLTEEARARIGEAARAHPAVTLATARGAKALFLAWGLFVVINVSLAVAAVAERAKVESSRAPSEQASALAVICVVAHLIPLALIWIGSHGVARERRWKYPLAGFLALAILQTAVLVAVVVPLAFFILVIASGHGVSD